ncbi:MAG: NUDIX hydrolase [Bacteroidetes bacterium]|nr:NUDIX hydrolase [Bacteroidota bacterium]MCW5893963.1 NUDIX hydrolase [Bacteroidota bacterium]
MDLKRLKRDVLYTGKVFDLIVDQVEYPSGNTGVREIARHPGGAVVVPLLDSGMVMMVRQLRYPLGVHVLELPAGKLDKGEDPAAAARRELEEETGWLASSLHKLTSIYTTPGFCDEELHIYLATDLHQAEDGHKREEGELSMTVHFLPLSDAVKMAERGELKDSKTIIGLLLAQRYREREV